MSENKEYKQELEGWRFKYAEYSGLTEKLN